MDGCATDLGIADCIGATLLEADITQEGYFRVIVTGKNKDIVSLSFYLLSA